MKTLMINASPKRITSASRYFLWLLDVMMFTRETKRIDLSGPKIYDEIFTAFNEIEALVIALPVYVDGVPSHVLNFMQAAEKYCKLNDCKFKLYVIANCVFFEPHQCRHLINNMRSFCTSAGLEWGAGLGIGTGEMLSVLRLTPLFEFTRFILSLPIFLLMGDFMSRLANYSWISLIINVMVYSIISLGLFYSIWKMKRIIKNKETEDDFYTRITLVPRILFTLFANGYWVIRAALHGTGFWKIYEKR